MSDGTNSNAVNYLIPASGGTHAVSYRDQLSATPVGYDFRTYSINQFPFVPQGAYVDNSKNSTPVVLSFDVTGLTMTIPAGAYVALNFPAPKSMQISATGLGVTPITFVDYPVLPQVLFANGVSGSLSIPATPQEAPGYFGIEKIVDSTGAFGMIESQGAHTYTYNTDGTIATDTITDGVLTFKKTYTYTSGNLTSETAWVKQ